MKYTFLFLILASFACNSPNEVKHERTETSETVDSASAVSIVPSDQTVIEESGTDCKRQEPAPVLKKGSFPKATFELQPDKRTAIETFQNEHAETVVIKNWGCSYVALTFRFETARFESELSNIGFWYKRTVSLLNEINAKLDAPIDIIKGTERLMTAIEEDVPNGYQNLKLSDELDFENDPRNFVRIDKVEKLDGGKFAIEVTFAKGPL